MGTSVGAFHTRTHFVHTLVCLCTLSLCHGIPFMSRGDPVNDIHPRRVVGSRLFRCVRDRVLTYRDSVLSPMIKFGSGCKRTGGTTL